MIVVAAFLKQAIASIPCGMGTMNSEGFSIVWDDFETTTQRVYKQSLYLVAHCWQRTANCVVLFDFAPQYCESW